MGLWNKLFPHTLTWPELGISHPCSEDLRVKERVLYNRCAGKCLTPTVHFCLFCLYRGKGRSTVEKSEKMMRFNLMSKYFSHPWRSMGGSGANKRKRGQWDVGVNGSKDLNNSDVTVWKLLNQFKNAIHRNVTWELFLLRNMSVTRQHVCF